MAELGIWREESARIDESMMTLGVDMKGTSFRQTAPCGGETCPADRDRGQIVRYVRQ